MGLLDAMLPMNLLARPIMQQNYYIALRGDTPAGASQPLGSGTFDDAWDGSTQLWFDWAMNQVPENSTVFLGPTWVEDPSTHLLTNQPFSTNGCSGGGFTAKSGQRIVGAGIGVTSLQLVNHPSDQNNAAIGWDFTGTSVPFLNGFEVSDMTIDAGLGGTSHPNCGASGIVVCGKNIFITRVKVINWGSTSVSGQSACDAFAISGSQTSANQPPQNVLIENCIVESPSSWIPLTSSSPNGRSVGIYLVAPSAFPHQYCVIRNCFLDGGDNPIPPNSGFSKEIRGIMADGGLGTIVEGNRVLNCKYGGPYYNESSTPADSSQTADLIIRGNYYRNVFYGIYFKRANSGALTAFGRIIVLQNQFDLGNGSANPVAIGFDSSADNVTNLCYQNLIIRGNRIRPINSETPASGTLGIKCQSVGNLAIDNNWVDASSADLSVQRGTANYTQAFNNRTLSGDLLPVAITASGASAPYRHQGELTTDAELLYAEL